MYFALIRLQPQYFSNNLCRAALKSSTSGVVHRITGSASRLHITHYHLFPHLVTSSFHHVSSFSRFAYGVIYTFVVYELSTSTARPCILCPTAFVITLYFVIFLVNNVTSSYTLLAIALISVGAIVGSLFLYHHLLTTAGFQLFQSLAVCLISTKLPQPSPQPSNVYPAILHKFLSIVSRYGHCFILLFFPPASVCRGLVSFWTSLVVSFPTFLAGECFVHFPPSFLLYSFWLLSILLPSTFLSPSLGLGCVCGL